jgi:RHS repeat-associated protein
VSTAFKHITGGAKLVLLAVALLMVFVPEVHALRSPGPLPTWVDPEPPLRENGLRSELLQKDLVFENLTLVLELRPVAAKGRICSKSPFGNIIAQSGPLADANVYRFSSKEYHANSGLYYFERRFYDPSLQRFVNRDPSGISGGLNLYEFVGNSPINGYDAWGLDFLFTTSEALASVPGSIYRYLPLNSMNADTVLRWSIECGTQGIADTGEVAHVYRGLDLFEEYTLSGPPTKVSEPSLVQGRRELPSLPPPEAVPDRSHWDGLVIGAPAATYENAHLNSLVYQTVTGLPTLPIRAAAFTQADVEAAIASLEARGFLTSEVQSSLDPNQIIAIAEAMRAGTFRNSISDLSPVIIDASKAILAGNHRMIAAEMTGYNLATRPIPISVPSRPLSSVPLQPGRINPPILVP